MTRVTRCFRAAGTAAVLALALAGLVGCGGKSGGTAAGPSAAAGADGGIAGVTPTSSADGGSSASATPILPDGRSPAYLTGLDIAGKTVTFDLIEFLTGEAAKTQWKKEHPDDPDGPPNDYLIVNNNKKLRTLPVATGAPCVVLSTLGGIDTKTITFAQLPALLTEQNKDITLPAPDIAILPFWLTVKNGQVVKLEEQFLP